MKKINVAITGANGRIGKNLISLISSSQYKNMIRLVGAFEKSDNVACGKSIAEISGLVDFKDILITGDLENSKNLDVLIDFSSPKCTLKYLKKMLEIKKPMVIGTTGLSKKEQQIIKESSSKIPILLAPNMSMGINVLFKVTEIITRILGENFDLEVLEAHHNKKKDSPSGTALKLIFELCKARGWDFDKVYQPTRHGFIGPRPKKEIGVNVIRGGDIAGNHKVFFIGEGETLEISHSAHSRKTFAQGALHAALWIINKSPGFYDMQDALNLNNIFEEK